MERPPEIKINRLQLDQLLNDEQKYFFDKIIAENVFCRQCGGSCKAGITISVIILTDLNDVLVKGSCNTCNGKVARVMELGEDEKFYKKAMDFRTSIRN